MAALDNIASELLKSANEADLIFKKTRDQAQRDKAVRLRRIVENLRNITLGASDLNGLSDVAISSPTNAQVLSYNSTTLKWQNTTISTATPTLAQVTTAGNTTTNAITVGGLVVDTNTLVVDSVNNRVGIGTANPSSLLEVVGNYAGAIDSLIPQLKFQNSNTTSSVNLFAIARVLVGTGYLGGFPEIWIQAHRDASNNGTTSIRTTSNHPLNFWTNDVERLRIFANGNVGIGTTTDAGYRLDVNGTGRFSDTLLATANASNHLGLIVQPNSQGNAVFRYLRTATTNFATFEFANGSVSSSVAKWGIGLRETNDNDFHFYNHTASKDQLVIKDNTGNVLIGTTTDAGYKLQVQGPGYFNTNTASTNSVLRLTDANTGTAWAGFSSSTTTGFFIGSNGGITLGQVTADNSNPSTAHARISINSLGNPGLQLSTNSANVGIVFSDGVNATIRMNFPSVGEAAITTISAHNLSIGVASSVGSLSSTTMKFFQSTGNVAINSTTDAGYKLDVNGTARVGSLGLYGNNGTITAPLIRFNGSNQVNVDPQGYGIVTNHTLITGNYIFSSGGGIRSNDRFAAKSGTSVVSTPFMSYGISRPDADVNMTLLAGMGGVHDGASWAQGLGLVFYTSNGPDISGGGYLTEKMRITSAGNVGIGTTSPFGKVDVKDGEIFVTTSTNANLRSRLTYQGLYVSRASDGTYPEQITSISSAWEYHTRNNHVFYRDGSPYFQIGTTGTASYLTIATTGNVLINTTTDSGYKLDVNGTARFSGNTYLAGDILVSNGGGTRYIQASNGSIGFLSSNSSGYNLWTDNSKVGIKSELYINNDLNYNVGIRLRTSTTQTSPSGYGHELSFQPQVNHVPTHTSIRILDGTYGGSSTTPSPIYIFGGQNTTTGTYGHVILQSDFTTERGNVGIGTPSPAYKFHISSSAAANIFATVQATNASASAAWVGFNDQSDNIVYRVFGSSVSGTQFGQSLTRSASLIANLGGSGKFLIGTYSSTDLVFGTGDQSRMRLVDSTGNFLVGTMTDAGNKLEVSGTINATAYKINGILGWSGIINIPTIPPISITVNNGIITNVM